ncbi:MAG: phosphoribosylformylglycinamidine synthase subunit PurQ [Candidatus Aenigmatarchaeota archaeon]
MRPNSLIITGNGLNTEKEIDYSLRVAGANTRIASLYELLDNDLNLKDYKILALCGGFADGDDLGAGVATSQRLKKVWNELQEFFERDTMTYGTCNGFQILLKAGVLNENGKRDVTLTYNDSGFFYNGWVRLKANKDSQCVFTRGMEDIYLPVRHGEGKFVVANDTVRQRLHRNGQIAIRYVDEQGDIATKFPENPNGSVDGIAGVCNTKGNVFVTMPHFEAFNDITNHPHYSALKRRFGKAADEIEPDGKKGFKNYVEHFS